MDSNNLNEGSKFKLDCVESKNSYILTINAINFKQSLNNFEYFSERPGSLLVKLLINETIDC